MQTLVNTANQTCTDASGVFVSGGIGEIVENVNSQIGFGKQLDPLQAQPQGEVVGVPVTVSSFFGANLTCAIDQVAGSAEEPANDQTFFSPFAFEGEVVRACDATCTRDIELSRECINGDVGDPGCEGPTTTQEVRDCNTGLGGLCPIDVETILPGALFLLLDEEEQDINTELSPESGSGSTDISPAEPD